MSVRVCLFSACVCVSVCVCVCFVCVCVLERWLCLCCRLCGSSGEVVVRKLPPSPGQGSLSAAVSANRRHPSHGGLEKHALQISPLLRRQLPARVSQICCSVCSDWRQSTHSLTHTHTRAHILSPTHAHIISLSHTQTVFYTHTHSPR